MVRWPKKLLAWKRWHSSMNMSSRFKHELTLVFKIATLTQALVCVINEKTILDKIDKNSTKDTHINQRVLLPLYEKIEKLFL